MSSVVKSSSIRFFSLFLFLFLWTLASYVFQTSLLPNPSDVFIKIIEEIKKKEIGYFQRLVPMVHFLIIGKKELKNIK